MEESAVLISEGMNNLFQCYNILSFSSSYFPLGDRSSEDRCIVDGIIVLVRP